MNPSPSPRDEVTFFEQASAGWSRRYETDPSFAQRRERILAAVRARVPAGARLLDFGCGAGDLSSACGALGYRMVAGDVSAGMVAQTAARLRAEGLVAEVVAFDEHSPALPFANASLGGCVASSVLEYVPDVGATLAELSRVLAPGARLLVTVPNTRSPLRRKERLMRLMLALPLAQRVLAHTRWREGAQYLSISRNRGSVAWWSRRLDAVGLTPLPEAFDATLAGGALVLLVAEKKS